MADNPFVPQGPPNVNANVDFYQQAMNQLGNPGQGQSTGPQMIAPPQMTANPMMSPDQAMQILNQSRIQQLASQGPARAPVPPMPGADTAAGKQIANTQLQQLVRQNLPYLAMGMLAGRGGTAGIATAAGVAALAEYLKSRQKQKAAPIQRSDQPKQQQKKGGPVKKAPAKGYAKGGKVKGFRGGSSPLLASIAEDAKKGKRTTPMAPRLVARVPPARVAAPTAPVAPDAPANRFVPGSSPLRHPLTGQFSKGGAVRGCGAAIRGCSFKGES